MPFAVRNTQLDLNFMFLISLLPRASMAVLASSFSLGEEEGERLIISHGDTGVPSHCVGPKTQIPIAASPGGANRRHAGGGTCQDFWLNVTTSRTLLRLSCGCRVLTPSSEKPWCLLVQSHPHTQPAWFLFLDDPPVYDHQ